jgi:hypothetical protein
MNGKSQTLNGAVTLTLSPPMFRNFRMPSLMMASLLLVVGFLVLTLLVLMIPNSFQTAPRPILGVDGWVSVYHSGHRKL